MSLEEYIPDLDNAESWSNSSEAINAVSEKFKEQIKKSQAGQKRTQTDEKKAKKNDMLLAGFLVKIIINKKYDILLSSLFTCTRKWYPSNFILWLLSLVYTDISDTIRTSTNKQLINFQYNWEKNIIFDDNNLSPEIKSRINNWIEDIMQIVSLEYSSIQTKELLNLLANKTDIIVFTANIFKFFLNELTITIDNNKSISIADFILDELEKEIKKLEIETI